MAVCNEADVDQEVSLKNTTNKKNDLAIIMFIRMLVAKIRDLPTCIIESLTNAWNKIPYTEVSLSSNKATSMPVLQNCSSTPVKMSEEGGNEVPKQIAYNENLNGSPAKENEGHGKNCQKAAQTKEETHNKKEQNNQSLVATVEHKKRVSVSTRNQIKMPLKTLCSVFTFLALIRSTSGTPLADFSQNVYYVSKDENLRIQWENGSWDDRVFVNDKEIGVCNSWYGCSLDVKDSKDLNSEALKLNNLGSRSYELEITQITCFFRNVSVVPTGDATKWKTADIIVAGCDRNSGAPSSVPPLGFLAFVAFCVVGCKYL